MDTELVRDKVEFHALTGPRDQLPPGIDPLTGCSLPVSLSELWNLRHGEGGNLRRKVRINDLRLRQIPVRGGRVGERKRRNRELQPDVTGFCGVVVLHVCGQESIRIR